MSMLHRGLLCSVGITLYLYKATLDIFGCKFNMFVGKRRKNCAKNG